MTSVAAVNRTPTEKHTADMANSLDNNDKIHLIILSYHQLRYTASLPMCLVTVVNSWSLEKTRSTPSLLVHKNSSNLCAVSLVRHHQISSSTMFLRWRRMDWACRDKIMDAPIVR